MTNSSKQGFRIASPADIKAQADIMCRAILSSESGMEMVLDMLYATVLNKIHFSRTLAILVGEISRRLPVEVGDEFLKRITAEVVDIFRQYYNVDHALCKSPNICNINIKRHAAVSAFIGDLFRVKLITFSTLELCTNTLMDKITLPIHIALLVQILLRAGSRQRPEFTPEFVQHCLRTVNRARTKSKHLRVGSQEEQDLQQLLYCGFRQQALGVSFPLTYVDSKLDLEDALQSSACIPDTWTTEHVRQIHGTSSAPSSSVSSDLGDGRSLHMPHPVGLLTYCYKG